MNFQIKGCFLLLFFLLLKNTSFCQDNISGIIVDGSTNEPLAFASVIFNKDRSLLTLSDIDGRFFFQSSRPLKSMVVRYLGYETKIISNIEDKVSPLIIKLTPAMNELEEVVVVAEENPVNKIIRKVIDNKAKNNPKNLASFQYYSYNKTVFDTENKDSLELFQNSHLFIMESVTRRKYKNPDLSEEVILGTKVSGFENPKFAALATEFQPFSFYNDIIKLYDIDYLNPISKGSLDKYEFHIKDTLFKARDSVYVISFEPFPNKNFQSLSGTLYINTNKYALQNVIATPTEKGKIDIVIQQQYKLINDEYWFPEQLNYELVFLGNKKSGDEVFVEGRSYIDSVQINIPINRKDFSFKNIRFAKNATKKDNGFWESYRKKELDSTDLKTYYLLDSLGQKYHFDRYLNIFSGLLARRIPIGFIDLDISKTFIYNKYEGYRLGTGLYTNEKLFEKFTFGGFFGYGLKDEDWKYGGKISYHPSNRFSVSTGYSDDLAETGKYDSDEAINIFNLRRYIAFRFDNTKKFFLKFAFKPFRYLDAKIVFEQTKTIPKYEYAFWHDGISYTEYRNSAMSIDLRFAFGEKNTDVLGQLLRQRTKKYPVLSLSYTKGIEGIFKSDWSYNKIEIGISQHFHTLGLGVSYYKVEGGIVDDPIPYGLLFTGQGSFDDNFPFVMKDYFQAMLPYEFLSDQYANLFFSHDFGTLLFKLDKFQPHISVHQNIGWGDLSQPPNHLFVNFKTMNKIYFESGLQIDNILKINYLDLGYIGFGIAGFYRYGYYSLSEFEDNIALKATIGFTFK